MAFRSVNPATGEMLRSFEAHAANEVELRLERARAAASAWRGVRVQARALVLAQLAELLEREKQSLARLMTLEMGKPIRAAVAEAEKCALACRHYSERAEAYLAPELVDGPDQRVVFEPLGVILAVMPWNFPFWQVIRFAAPALLAGNAGVLKHASNVPQCALALEDLFRRAGAPEGVFQTLLVAADKVESLIADPRISAVTVTGSEGTGQAVATAAGRHLKKCVLELGGSDPFIVMPSADLDRAIATGVKARAINNGQSCIAAKRFIVASAVFDRFCDGFVEGMRRLRTGDPLDESTELGPLATPAGVDKIDDQVRRAVDAGGRVLTGGRRPAGPGNFYEPTVIVGLPPALPARDEFFGPVATLFRAETPDDAIRLANDSPFGLGASVWTRDRAEAERFAEALEVGSVFVNDMVASDPRFPFGGVKASGYGRELGLYGLREFVNVKTVRAFSL